MHWSIYALISAACAALVAILGKIGLAGVDSTLATTVRSVVMAVFLVGVALLFGKVSGVSELSNKALVFIILSGIAGALSWLAYFFALKNGPASGVVALDRMSIIFALGLAVLFLGETLTWSKGMGAVLIAVGAFLMF